MGAFTNSENQDTLANWMDQLKLFTNQLQSIQLQNDESKANDVQVYPTRCRFYNGPSYEHRLLSCKSICPRLDISTSTRKRN